MENRRRWGGRPSPAMIVAVLALIVALTGSAMAAGAVPLARRALTADNAKKLGGLTPKKVLETAVGISLLIGPLSIKHLVVVKSAPWSLPPSGQGDFSAPCPTGQSAVSGGFDDATNTAIPAATRPGADAASWRVFIVNTSTTAAASGSVYAVCAK